MGLALMKSSEATLRQLPFERLLSTLNSKQFPVFTQPPSVLLDSALSYRVSKRLAVFEVPPSSPSSVSSAPVGAQSPHQFSPLQSSQEHDLAESRVIDL